MLMIHDQLKLNLNFFDHINNFCLVMYDSSNLFLLIGLVYFVTCALPALAVWRNDGGCPLLQNRTYLQKVCSVPQSWGGRFCRKGKAQS